MATNTKALVDAGYAKLVASGKVKRGRPEFGPNSYPARRPGTVLVRVPMVRNGVAIDRDEAERSFAGKPWAGELRYLGAARGFHLFERERVEGDR